MYLNLTQLIFWNFWYHRDVDKIADLMDDIQEQQDIANEISEAISNPVGFGADVDEDELLAELDELEQVNKAEDVMLCFWSKEDDIIKFWSTESDIIKFWSTESDIIKFLIHWGCHLQALDP